jgi:sugar lactone lactonase YvrE
MPEAGTTRRAVRDLLSKLGYLPAAYSQAMKFKLAPKIAAGLLAFAPLAAADNFFVANFGINTITRYNADGIGVPFTDVFIDGPNGLALDSSGNLYVSTNSNVIRKFSPAGVDLGVFASTGLNFVMGMAFDSQGNLYAANFGGNTIEKFSPDGIDLGVFANVILGRPTGLAFDSSGNLYVASFGNTIARFSPNGTPLPDFTSFNLNNPVGLAFTSSGNLYAANSAADTISVFSPAGLDLGTLVSPNLSGPFGLGVDSASNLYVVNSLSATIDRFLFGGIDTIFAATGFSPSFIAVQRTPTLVNISTRLNVLTGENVLDAGFIIVGAGTKTLLIRGLGPSLATAGIMDTLANPILELHNSATDALIASNDNWKNNQQSEIAATGIPPTNDNEAAIVVTLSAGAYTVIQRGKLDTTGIGLVEVYDLSPGFGPELANISTRGFVDTGENVMIAGFIAASSSGGSGEVILRALGPSLASAGVMNPLLDPTLELYDSNGVLLASNDNWKATQQAEIEATGIPPTNDAEAAIVRTFAPGSYTAIVRGKDDTTGVGLVEAYNLH